ncbi:MAG TPA: hypothetical protein PKE26_05905 [Kiritimatiellia bacterium]|nr:hypothetical protein [Kiritimatiellia bacterium]HMO98628.1 hypothetical protein [Kiritimatiellia bacterium]
MSVKDFNLNRPIHLARRDAYFERAVELLYMPMQEMDTNERLTHVDKVLSLLKTAQFHAFFTTKSPRATQHEHDLLHFMQLISHNVQSAYSMMQHQSHLEGEEGFLCQFLDARPDECVLPAMHYRRRADDIFHGLWHLLRLGHKPYRNLQQTNVQSLSPPEQERYRKAYRSFREEIMLKFPSPRATAAKVS